MNEHQPAALEPAPGFSEEEAPVHRAIYRGIIDQGCRPLFRGLEAQLDIDEVQIPNSTRKVKARVYHRKNSVKPGAIVLWLHNGGGVIGDLDTEHVLAAEHCLRTGYCVVQVDYVSCA